jgi:DNA invertase Pin-like site-specific DNA recombinase
MRVAIYARVSIDDKGQDPGNQLGELRAWVTNSGHKITQEYVDYESGRKGTEKRKQFAALFDDAAKRKFDCVLFWALDRFSREGMAQTIIYLQRLSSHGVTFHSYTEAHLATDNELVRNALLALLSSLAKVEAQKISERTKAGMCRAKARSTKAQARAAPTDRPTCRQRGDAVRNRQSAEDRPTYCDKVCELSRRRRALRNGPVKLAL